MAKYQSLSYYGGKASLGKGKWIASLLPWEKETCYIEPFGGMFSVLLNREPVDNELVNDLNDRLINWARVVRDHPEEIGWLVENTPRSYKEYTWALENLDNPELSDIQRALAFHVVINQSVQQGDGRTQPSTYSRKFKGGISRWRSERVAKLSERLFNVQLLCEDALGLMGRTIDKTHIVMYCDPPYSSADTTPYRFRDVNRDELKDMLLQQKGRVAISGYGDEWNDLDWNRYEKSVHFNGMGQGVVGNKSKKTEILWTNYTPQLD